MSPRLRVRNGVVLVFVSSHSALSQQEQGFTRSMGSDVVDVCVVTTSMNFNSASLLYLSCTMTKAQKIGSSSITRGETILSLMGRLFGWGGSTSVSTTGSLETT